MMKKSLPLLLLALGLGPVAGAAPDILCIGDSLTQGEGGKESPWPAVLETLSGRKTWNRGLPGWTPRHLTYAFLLRDSDNLTVADLRRIPPVEMENRRFQKDINNRRTLMADGQLVIVREGARRVTYLWNAAATDAPSPDTDPAPAVVKPAAVDDPAHLPPLSAGRWLREDKPPSWKRTGELADLCILWIGANGMDRDELAAGLADIEARFRTTPDRRVFVIGLVNRQPHTSSPKAIANWAALIDACNDHIRAAYPDNHLDLQAWFTRTGPYKDEGGFRTADWFPDATPAQIADDEADQAAGIVPRSLRAPKNVTHLNADGYRIIGTLLHQTLQQKHWLD